MEQAGTGTESRWRWYTVPALGGYLLKRGQGDRIIVAKNMDEKRPAPVEIGGAPLPTSHEDERVEQWDEWADQSFGRVVFYLDKARRCYLDTHLRPLGISSAQMPVLTYLWEGHDGDTQSVIAEVIGVDPATVTRVAQKLEDKGLITRRVSGRDARALHLSLTDAGWALAEPVRAVSSAWTDEITAHLTTERSEEILRALQLITVRAQGACSTAKSDHGTPDPDDM